MLTAEEQLVAPHGWPGGLPGPQPAVQTCGAVQYAAGCIAAYGCTPTKFMATAGLEVPYSMPAPVLAHLQRLRPCGRSQVPRRPSRLNSDDRRTSNDQEDQEHVSASSQPPVTHTTPAVQDCTVPQSAGTTAVGVQPPAAFHPGSSPLGAFGNIFATLTGVAAGITWQQQQQQPCSAPLLRPWLKWVQLATRLLLWRAWAAAAPGTEQQWGTLRVCMATVCSPILQAVPGLLAAAWRSWGALQQGPVKEEGLALLLAQAGSLPALAHNQRLLLAVAQQVAPLQASPSTGPLTTWLAASPSFQALLAQEPALMDAYLLELGRWSQRRAAHQCAAWKVLAALPRCLVVPLAQQRLHSSDRHVVVGAGVALTQL